MKRLTVDSSNIKSIGWESGILEVEFHNGGVYQYDGVPAHKHAALMAESSRPGGSVGSHFHKHIKNNHSFRKLTK